MDKPISPSAEKNKEPILTVLRRELPGKQFVLEIGSGTGQHACYFANALTDVVWQPSELAENISAIKSWLAESDLGNALEPIVLDVNIEPWPIAAADACFTCNTFHIINMNSVRAIFSGCKSVLGKSGKLCVYGPFTIDGKHISPSNKDFDQWLKNADPKSGVRDLTQLDKIAQTFGFAPCRRIEMPANNLMVVWEVG